MPFSYYVDKLCVTRCADRAELGALAGRAAGEVIREAIARRGEARVIFAAAPSQNETLETLVALPDIDWTKVVALHMDEYVGLPVGSSARFSHYLKTHCFERVPFKKVYYLDEERGLPVEELIARYVAILREAPIDLVVMGIGENGHVAFNDPPVDFNDPELVKVVALDDVCRRQQVNDGCFPNFESTPEKALTLTVPALALAVARVCAVPGPLKAEAVRKTLTEPISERLPASVMRTWDNARLFIDAESGALL